MRLFLASASVRGRVEALTELVGEGAVVGVSANAFDCEPASGRRDCLANELRALHAAGLSPTELDLRDLAGDPDGLRQAVDGLDMLWATGGNVFVLRRALARSGVDALLVTRLRADSLAYGGCSAGACVCGPTLRGIELIEDAGAAGPPIFDGLGLVGYSIAPHAGTAAMRPLFEHLERSGMPYRALCDGQAIVVDGEVTRTIDVW
jgi:dipeptidase E